MQIHQDGTKRVERPCAPAECALCGGCRKLHRHGSYQRYHGCNGDRRVEVSRFLCPQCGHTWSVIPEGLLPYRSLPVATLESALERVPDMAGGDGRSPPASETEKGCIRRTLQRLSERMDFLCGLFGQQMPLLGGKDIAGFWRALRMLGPTQAILVRLARDFKTSLLGCYLSLRPHWERERPPAPALAGA